MKRSLVLLAALTAVQLAAAAETVYRCGSDYSKTPCAGGQAVQVDDSRTPAQQHQAEDAARREAKLAGQMARERQAQEAKAAKAAARIGPTPAAAASKPAHAKAKKKKHPSKPDRNSELTPPLAGSRP
jgi:hypothetical protein